MKNDTSVIPYLFFLSFFTYQLHAQSVIAFDSFEEAPASKTTELGYTVDNFSNGFSNYFDRISNTTGGTGATVTYHIFSGVPENINDDGSGDKYFWGCDDLDDSGNQRVDDLGLMTFNNVSVTGYTNLEVKVALAQGRALRFETSDYIRIYYALDSDISTHPATNTAFSVGNYTLLAEFKGSGSSTNLSLNGAGATTLSTGSFNDYTFEIPATGNALSIRIVMATNGGDEEILVDNMRVRGNGGCVNPDVPSVSVSNPIFTSGASVDLNISGALNGADKWYVYSGLCGGTFVTSSASAPISVNPPDGITTYYVRGEDGCVSPGACGEITVYAAGTISTTYTAGVWNNGSPNAAYNVIINDDYTATSNLNLYSLKINSDKDFDLDTHDLTITADLTLESGASFLDDGTTTVGGTQTLKRLMNASALSDFHLMSAPVSGGDFEASFQESYAYRYVGGEYNNIYSFDNGTAMILGEGVAVSGNGMGATTRSYYGTFNKGLIDYEFISSDQWHLLGNPYPAPLSLNSFYSINNTSIRPTFYFYNENTGAYDTWNTSLNSGTGSATANAGVTQGFFVEELTGSATQVTYIGSMRTLANNVFLRETQTANSGTLKLKLNNAETILAWTDEASNGDDINDASYLQGTAKSGLYSILDNKSLAIQAIHTDFDNKTIPLGYYALEDGLYSISIGGLAPDENIDIMLIDRYENTIENLKLAPYQFFTEGSDGFIDDRFEIVLAKSSLSLSEHENEEATIRVSGGDVLNVISDSSINSIYVFDITGALVHQATKISLKNYKWSGAQSKGIYLVKIVSTTSTSNHKIFLK